MKADLARLIERAESLRYELNQAYRRTKEENFRSAAGDVDSSLEYLHDIRDRQLTPELQHA